MSIFSSIIEGPYAVLARVGVWALAVLALVGFGWFKGVEHEAAKHQAYLAAQAVATSNRLLERTKIVTEVQTVYVEKAAQTKIVKEYIHDQSDKYAASNTGYCLDDEFRRLHDTAADNRLNPGAREVHDPGRTPSSSAR